MAFKKDKKKKKQGMELPEIIKKYNIRVSTPNGCFPEDVERILQDLEKQLNNLIKENERLTKQYEQKAKDFSLVEAENQKLRFQIMSFNYEDTSELQDFNNLGKLTNINPTVGSMPETKPQIPAEPEIPLAVIEDEPKVFDNLVSDIGPPQNINITITENEKKLADIYTADGKLDIL